MLGLLSRSLPVRYFEFVPGWAEISASHHARILSALEARDAHEAQRVMEHHLAESGDHAVEILQEMGYWGPIARRPGRSERVRRGVATWRRSTASGLELCHFLAGRTRAWCWPTSGPRC